MDEWLEPYKEDLDQALQDIADALAEDERVQAAWLSGSFGRGTEDALSDIDLHIAVADEDVDEWLDDRTAFYAKISEPLLIRPDKPSNAGPGVYQGVIFPGPLILDLNVHPASTARPTIDHRSLLSRVSLKPGGAGELDETALHARRGEAEGHFWAMTPIALKYLARGQIDRAVVQVYLLQSAYVTMWRSINDSDRLDAGGPFWLHPVHDQALMEKLPVLGPVIDAPNVLEVISSLMTEMVGLRDNFRLADFELIDEVIEEITFFRNDIADAVLNDTPLLDTTGSKQRIRVDSSMIDSIGYDPATKTLEIEFTSGHIYHYFDVPPREYRTFLAADSKGSYFRGCIDGAYRYRKVR